MEKKRLSKALAAAGVASRRACEELIFAGRVQVNGQVVLLPQTLVEWGHDKIECDGKVVSCEEKKVYYILNKPKGYLCTSRKHREEKIVLDLFQDQEERIFTVGRLDRETEGLIIVTNDGHYANRVIHPSADIQKEYLVKTDFEVGPEHLTVLAQGTLVEGVYVKPVRVTKVRRGTLKVVIAEGKKREVRLLMEAAQLPVKHLSRIRIGGLHLGPLPLGSWRPMSEKEREMVFQ